MDTSEPNIKKCEKAWEIQKLWKPRVGDWFYKRDGVGFGLWLICKLKGDILLCSGERMSQPPFTGQFVEFRVSEDYIWLPLQDQLQEMMLPTLDEQEEDGRFIGCAPFILNERLHASLHGDGIYNWGKSYEELWLTFVMKENYGKIWNGSNWFSL